MCWRFSSILSFLWNVGHHKRKLRTQVPLGKSLICQTIFSHRDLQLNASKSFYFVACVDFKRLFCHFAGFTTMLLTSTLWWMVRVFTRIYYERRSVASVKNFWQLVKTNLQMFLDRLLWPFFGGIKLYEIIVLINEINVPWRYKNHYEDFWDVKMMIVSIWNIVKIKNPRNNPF